MKNQELRNSLLQIINSMDAGTSEICEEDEIKLLKMINTMTNTENKFSKYQACKYLGVSRSTFDRYVKDGLIPEGRKQQGFKELFWIKSDLIDAKNRINNR